MQHTVESVRSCRKGPDKDEKDRRANLIKTVMSTGDRLIHMHTLQSGGRGRRGAAARNGGCRLLSHNLQSHAYTDRKFKSEIEWKEKGGGGGEGGEG